MKLVHVIPHVDKEAAGPSYSVPRLCQGLAALGNEVELSCLAARGQIEGVRLDVHPQWPILSRFAVSTSLAESLWQKAKTVDVVHNHSLWSMINVAAGWAVPGRGARLVTSPRGTLSAVAMKRQQHLKRAVWPFQRRALARADLLHATSEAEYQDIRSHGLVAPVLVVPNGIDLPSADALRPSSDNGMRTLLYLGRVHPIKGLDRLLSAWAELQDEHPDWRLVIAGDGEAAHVKDVRSAAIAKNVRRLSFAGALYGAEKSRAYQTASLFVLPTHSENFGMVVAEALAHGCPAVVSRGAPWAGLNSEDCGWWVDNGIEELARSLHQAMSLPPARLQAMGARGRAWMARDYGWQSVSERVEAGYRWLLDGGACPPCVRLD